jgi:2-dehydro-3-deoxy-D-gluconate 5-dehydrogenase
MFDLKGRVAIVTGGNGGIGLGMARGLASAGARVVIAARNAEKSRAAVDELARLGAAEPLAIEVDVADESSVASMVGQAAERCGRIDVLVNNAGIQIRGKQPQDYSVAEWHRILDTNLTSGFLCARAVHPVFKRVGGESKLKRPVCRPVVAGPRFEPAPPSIPPTARQTARRP